ncbi:MAG: hypothetical protein JSR46_04605 [Verrucomicrobia bacterium]|nr:hypothetical protein [Verrucomicrobiota bacterium]
MNPTEGYDLVNGVASMRITQECDVHTLLASAIRNEDINRAVEQLISILSIGSLEKNFKQVVEGWLDFLQVEKMLLYGLYPDYEDAVNGYLKVSKNTKLPDALRLKADQAIARLCLKGKCSFLAVDLVIEKLLRLIGTSSDRWEVMEASLLASKLLLANPKTSITDRQTVQFLQLIIDNKNFNEEKRLEAEYIRALFICQDRAGNDKNATYPKAFEVFQRIKMIAHSALCSLADCQMLFMQAKGVIPCGDYDLLAQALLAKSKDKEIPLEMQGYAAYHLADLVLTNCTKVLTIDEAHALMNRSCTDESLPEHIRKAATCSLKQFSPQFSSSGYSSEEKGVYMHVQSVEYERSLQMKKKISRFPNYNPTTKTLYVNRIGYTPITSKCSSFFTHPTASCGAASEREVILLDPENSPLLNEHFTKILKILSEDTKKRGTLETIKIVADYVYNTIFWDKSGDLVLQLKNYVNELKSDTTIHQIEDSGTKVPCIPIDRFISKGRGVCRHHSIVTAYILDGLTKQRPPYLSGAVQIVRDTLKSGSGHSWAAFVNNSRKVHTDTLLRIVSDISDPGNRKMLESHYGADVVERMVQKLNRYQNI